MTHVANTDSIYLFPTNRNAKNHASCILITFRDVNQSTAHSKSHIHVLKHTKTLKLTHFRTFSNVLRKSSVIIELTLIRKAVMKRFSP